MDLKQKYASFLLSFIAGYVDTAGFIALAGIFTAHVTGNIVMVGAAVVEIKKNSEIVSRLLLIPVFMLGVILTSRILKILKGNDAQKLNMMFILQALLLFLFAFSDVFFSKTNSNLTIETRWIIEGSIGVLALAIQNVYMKIVLSKMVPTTVMTGNLTGFSIELENLLSAIFFKTDKNTINLLKIGNAILGFLAGAVFGALCVCQFGLLCLLFPVFLLVLLVLYCNPIKI